MPHQIDISKQDSVASFVRTSGEAENAAVELLATGRDDIAKSGLLTGRVGNVDATVSTGFFEGTAKSVFSGKAKGVEPQASRATFWDRYKATEGASKSAVAANVQSVVDDVVSSAMSESDELDGFVKLKSGTNKVRQIHRGIRRIGNVATSAKSRIAGKAAVGSVQQGAAATTSAKGVVAAKASASSTVVGATSSGGGAAVGAAAAPVIIVIVAILSLVLLIGIVAGSEQDKIGGLSENESIVATLLKEQGFDEVHIAAIMGNWVCESGCNPRRVQCGYGYCRDADGNGIQDCEEQDNYPPELIDNKNAGYGLAQWTYPTRARALVNFASEQGKPSGDAAVQVAFFANEFRHARVNFEAIDDVEEACRWFHDVYERSADGAEGIAKRVSEAKRIYAILTGAGAQGYVSMALAIANDDSHGYSMANRTMNPDVDCSSFVYYSLLLSGWSQDQLGGSYPFTTHNMGPILESAGFTRFDYTGMQDLQPGDILVNPARHTEIYYGDGLNLGAHGNYDGRSGDSSGREVCLGSFWESGWVNVYRLAA